MAQYCPFCETKLVYRGIDANIDNITEKWWCRECKERIEVDEPGMRHLNVIGMRDDYRKMIETLKPDDLNDNG